MAVVTKELIDHFESTIMNTNQCQFGCPQNTEAYRIAKTRYDQGLTNVEYVFKLYKEAKEEFLGDQEKISLEEELQLYIVENAPDLVKYIDNITNEVLSLMFKKYGEESFKKRSIAGYASANLMQNYDKQLIIEMLCGHGCWSADDIVPEEIKLRIAKIMAMPSFSELSDAEKKHILHYNSYMLNFFNPNDYEYQKEALKLPTGQYSSVKLGMFPSNIPITRDTCVLLLNEEDFLVSVHPRFKRALYTFSIEDQHYIIREVYNYSIKRGVSEIGYSFAYKEEGLKLYEEIYHGMIVKKKEEERNLKPGKVIAFSKAEKEFIEFIEKLLYGQKYPKIYKEDLIYTIAKMPEILKKKDFQIYLKTRYSKEPQEIQDIYDKAVLLNNHMIQIICDVPNFTVSNSVWIQVVENNSQYIMCHPNPSEELCALVYKKNSNTYSDMYQHAGIDTMIDAITDNPGNIEFAYRLGIFDSKILIFTAFVARKKGINPNDIPYFNEYSKELDSIEERSRGIAKRIEERRKKLNETPNS